MKYIRTKDGRIITPLIEPDIFDKQELENVEILKQADTIEELCDEFVYYNVYQERNIVLSDYQETYIHYGTINETPFYGAIWTDKGLIYVAKINDKGDLELL